MDQDSAWFGLSAVGMQTEAVEGKDGFVALMPPRKSPATQNDSRSEDDSNEDEGSEQMQANDKMKGETKQEQAETALEGQREFVLWEMVNCVDGR